MITRPLDLASKLRPEPRNFHALFFVNAGLIAYFFTLFGSQFVLAPGVKLKFEVPRIAGAEAGAVVTTHRITVERSGLIIIEDGPADIARLREWLKNQTKTTRRPVLLVRADVQVPTGTLTEIWGAAYAAGFIDVQLLADDFAESGGGR